MASLLRDIPFKTTFVANDAVSRWKVLLAHNGASPTCDALFDVISAAMEDVHVVDAPSAEAARSMLRRAPFDVCFVCLDLPPSPSGGIWLAQELVRAGCPIVLVTRSLRWLPKSASELKVLPWIAPEATADRVIEAVDKALGDVDFDNQVTLDSSEYEEDEEFGRPKLISEV